MKNICIFAPQRFNMIKFMENILKRAKNGYEKFQIRGAIKEIMRNYGLRTISLSNYFNYLNTTPTVGVHSVKYDIMNGYIKVYKFNDNVNNKKCGEAFDTVDINTYSNVYKTILDILNEENKIPNKIKRNILVKVSR